jgi:8-oxo-dGTP diphosphatase
MAMERKLAPSISVDCVILGFDSEQINVLLAERTLKSQETGETIFTDLTLTGYHIYEDEDLDQAAARIVRDRTGLESIKLVQFYSFGALDRLLHPNDQAWLKVSGDIFSNRVVTIGYYSLLPSIDIEIKHKSTKVTWYPINNIKGLAYDHDVILQKAMEHLRHTFWHEPIGFELLPVKFTLTQMQKLYEAIMGTTFDKRNFRKKISQMSYVVPLKEKQIGVAHKPAQLFMFSKDVYDKTRKDRFDFFV